MERDELAAWLRLVLTPGVGSDAARRLLAAFGLPQAVFSQSTAALRQVVTQAQATSLGSEPAALAAQLEATAGWLAEGPSGQRHVLTLADARYPAALLDIEDPPLMLYLVGPLPVAGWRGLAMVGSRNPTPQGLANARQFGKALAQAGLTVVSGLALGIDGAAHEGALEGAAAGQLATIAVVGTGLDRVYPKQHFDLAHRIAARGLIISEYPLGTPPLRANFPRRNRLIAGLSLGTLVVEAALKSGSLITARQAVEQGKEVFAIPGSIHATQSRGCHALLKQGAKLVESAQDVLEELRLVERAAPAGESRQDIDEDETQDAPVETGLLAVMGWDALGLDELVARTGIAPAQLQAQLLAFELEGEVARLAGGLFQRMSRV